MAITYAHYTRSHSHVSIYLSDEPPDLCVDIADALQGTLFTLSLAWQVQCAHATLLHTLLCGKRNSRSNTHYFYTDLLSGYLRLSTDSLLTA